MRVGGLDPGATGALAVIDTDLGTLELVDMPSGMVKIGNSMKNRVIPALLCHQVRQLNAHHWLIEKVGSIAPEGRAQGTSSMFAFGYAAGLAEGAVAGAGISYDLMAPQAWQKLARVAGGKDGARARACQLFPAYAHLFARVKDDGRADAACIAVANAMNQGVIWIP